MDANDRLNKGKEHAKNMGGELLSNVGVTYHKKLKWKCKDGHIWEQDFHHVVDRNQWCKDCRTFNIYNFCKENNLTLIKTFKNVKFTYRLSCNKCDKIFKSDNRALCRNSYPCPKCASNARVLYQTNKEVFLREDDISFYLLGVWYSDGYVYNRSKNSKMSAITSADKDWLEDIRGLLCPGRPVSKKKNRNCYELSINGEELYDWLVKWGCVENKSLIIKYPEKLPSKYFRDFLRGLTDGDGSVIVYNQKTKNGTKLRLEYFLCGAGEKLLSSVNDKLNELGFKSTLSKKKSDSGRKILGREIKNTCGFIYRIVSTGFEAAKIVKWLYYPENKISLQRKNEKAKLGIKTVESYMLENPNLYKGKIL